jgi:XisH protein
VSAKNFHHDTVIRALTADGWTITHDPLRLKYGDQKLYVDLGAERATLGAEKAGRKIAVEIQSFLGRSPVRDLQEALGQYETYRALLQMSDQDRQLYMAVTDDVHDTVLSDRFGQFVVSHFNLRLLVFDEERERITQWIEPTNTA